MNYFYSTKNLVGIVLALIGVILHFVGILAGPLWLPIVIGLYAFGALVTPQTRTDVQLAEEASVSELREKLKTFMKQVRGKVTPDIYQRLQAIETAVEDLLPRLKQMELQGDHNAFVVRQLIEEYLPDTFRNYNRLPKQYALEHRLADGRTPHQVIVQQLDLLQEALVNVTSDTARGDLDQLLANGRFLEEKFGESELKL